MTDAITYDELCENRPQIFTVDKHQSHATSGTVLVSSPPAMDMVSLSPGQQLNYDFTPGEGVTAYSVGTAEGSEAPPPTDDDDDDDDHVLDPHDTVDGQTDTQPAVDDDEGEPEFPKATGSGWYELSDGSKVQGAERAMKAEAEL